MVQTNNVSLHSDGLPWWLFDMRPQGYLGRAYASTYAADLGLPANPEQWADSDVVRALLAHGHDAIGNLLIENKHESVSLRCLNPPQLSAPPRVGIGGWGRRSTGIICRR
jgi:hypothetical protein